MPANIKSPEYLALRVFSVSPGSDLSQALVDANKLYVSRRYEQAVNAYKEILGPHIEDRPADKPFVRLSLARSYHALGDFGNAIDTYKQVVVSPDLPPDEREAAEIYLWQQLATAYLDQGDLLYRGDQGQAALQSYGQIITPEDTEPEDSPLYTAIVTAGAEIARRVIRGLNKVVPAIIERVSDPGQLQAVLSHLSELLGGDVNPTITSLLIEAQRQIRKFNGGLDFWGHTATLIPIWSFDYLQGVATNFAQMAISVERDVINFWSQVDEGKLTREQLSQIVNQCKAEVDAADAQVKVADEELEVQQDGIELAETRRLNAEASVTTYQTKSEIWTGYQATSAQLNSVDDSDPEKLDRLAKQIVTEKMGQWELAPGPSDNPPYGRPDYHINAFGRDIVWHWQLNPGLRPGYENKATQAAAYGLAASTLSKEYELLSLQNQAAELAKVEKQATASLKVATTRQSIAEATKTVASLRHIAAEQSRALFESAIFTPEVWSRMGNALYQLYRRYLDMALRTAKLMQLAYNFETDKSLSLIKSDYSASEIKGLLGADALMADIQSFTYDLVTQQQTKPQPLKQTISLATQYPFAFENQLRPSGRMEFVTRIDDFDAVYPGTYAGRIETIEVEIIGLVPPTGVTGTLTNSGISGYRVPAALWKDRVNTSGLKYRVQPKETLVLSDFNVRKDGALISTDPRSRRVFQGSGLTSSWVLELPMDLNDLNYGTLTDIRLTLYYKARFDPDLQVPVRTKLQEQPARNKRTLSIPLRWLRANLFARLHATGEVVIPLTKDDFPLNETNPVLTNLGVLVVTDGSVAAEGFQVTLIAPESAPSMKRADKYSQGAFEGDGVSGSAIGLYKLSIQAADGSTLVHDGKTPISNLALILGYRFEPRKQSKPSMPREENK